jgi:glycosyltransferase involved in cell wall biosynthesis
MNVSSKFAVGVPVFNEALHIEQTLLSIIETLGPEVPVIVSDNHSTDDTVAIVHRIAQEHPSIRLVVNGDDRVASNFLNCLLHARSEYFCWVSGHDLICGDYWRAALQRLDEDPSVLWVYGSCGLIDADGQPFESGISQDSDIDNSGLSDTEVFAKLLKIRSGMFVHGIFRTRSMLDCPLAGGWASDRCLIAYACFRGQVRWIQSIGIVRRIQRSADGGETLEERNERYRRWGCLEYEDAGFEHRHYMRMKLLRIYLDERGRSIGVRGVRSAIRALFGAGSWWRDLSVLMSLRKLRKVESSLPATESLCSIDETASAESARNRPDPS